MQTLIELIERHSDENSELRYYIKHIEESQANEVQHPDICIECCASLFQGVSKTIVNRLDPPQDREQFERDSIQRQVKKALRCLAASDSLVELGFPVAVENLVRILGELRNDRGDISHGRAVPKELQSDRSLARLVLNITEAIVRYMLASYFALKPERTFVPPYEENERFNALLDEANALPGKLIYSKALYDQFAEDYVIRLKEYNDELDARRADLNPMLVGGEVGGDTK
ncbi:abortive infection family protein [Mesorhizobium sp. B2-3-15]|uniref:abortive infection family protein n=1 Tax=Mesorhizobium sp. B2-3-15 TaxID=2589949 RepID=UPI00112C54B0|nr:abortive infection family protein [Mesorhizobium sp. B2-3-15]TPL72288.1 hypothetical protein FJ954_16470 [Mesorhizobium sp. B2-3-15]